MKNKDKPKQEGVTMINADTKFREEFEKDFLKKENEFPRITEGDHSVFDFNNKKEENGDIFLDGSHGKVVVGKKIIDEKEIFQYLNTHRREVRVFRYNMANMAKDNAVVQRHEEVVRGFSWVVRLYRWLRRHDWKLLEYEEQYLIDGLIHAGNGEQHAMLKIKNDKNDLLVVVYKLYHKRGYLVKSRSRSSLLDKDDSDVKYEVVDKIIQIKNLLRKMTEPVDNAENLLNI